MPAWAGVPLLALAAWFLFLRPLTAIPGVSPPAPARVAAWTGTRSGVWREFTFPTEQRRLLSWREGGVLQPTAAGELSSALYGSVRTNRVGRRFLAAFHEGIDIAPLARDLRGYPKDEIRSVAPGRVAYVNRHSGNSNYGKYVVVLHPDELGDVYTLYAHLDSIAPGLKVGVPVAAGSNLGRMGNTSSGQGIPRFRSHLHFEVGLIQNRGFSSWMKNRKIKNPHGTYGGWNLQGLDPLRFLARLSLRRVFSFSEFLAAYPRAFRLAVRADVLPDFFRRYPRLWEGRRTAPGALALSCSENGTVLSGRPLRPRERAVLGEEPWLVLEVDRQVLGRNGARLIVEDSGEWKLTSRGKRWLSLLLWPSRL